MSVADAKYRYQNKIHSEGAFQDQEQAAYEDFLQLFGRDPSESELGQLLPAYGASRQAGRAQVSQYYQMQENSPEKQYAKQRDQYSQDAPKYYGSVDGIFSNTLGRPATDAEKKHFGSLLASGQIDDYTLSQWMQQLPEYQQTQDKKFREGLSNELQSQDARYYKEQILPALQADALARGVSVSSGAENALALAAQQQNRQRESFLSNLSAQQYGGNKSNAYQDYVNSMANYQDQSRFNRQANYDLQNQFRTRNYELGDYAMQRDAYNDYLGRYGKRSKGQAIGSLVGGGLGAVAGAFSGTPWGVGAGWQAGSGLGGGFGSLWG